MQFALKITSAVVLGGGIVTPNTIVHTDEATAKNLLSRGKAEVATDADQTIEGDETPPLIEVKTPPATKATKAAKTTKE